jgi:AraC-like DNA-binding protein
MTDSEALFLYLPRDLFAQSAANLDDMSNTILTGNRAALLIDYINSIEARLSDLAAEDLPRVTNATRNMILACVDPSAAEVPAERAMILALMECARRFVQCSLGADLSPATMARALGISRTRLYELFEASGGVNHYIQKRRLMAAHAALSDPEDSRLIVDIATEVGFNSAANFSKEFGYSPREARNAALSPLPRRSGFSAEDQPVSFDHHLKILGS